MTGQEAVMELQRIQSELIRDIEELQSVARAMNVENVGTRLLNNYVVPHLKHLVDDDGEYSYLLPNLSDAISGVRRRMPK